MLVLLSRNAVHPHNEKKELLLCCEQKLPFFFFNGRMLIKNLFNLNAVLKNSP